MSLPTAVSLLSVALTSASVISATVVALPGSEEALPIPAWAYAVIAFAVFLLLAFVMWSFRDVANRHSHKTRGSAGHGADHGTAEHD